MDDEAIEWPDRNAAIKEGYSSPEKLKAFFDEVDEDLDAIRRINNERYEALRSAFMALLMSLDEKMPALRQMIADDLDEKAERDHRLRLMEQQETGQSEDIENHSHLAELATAIRLKSRI